MAAHWAARAFRAEHWKDAHWYGAEVVGSGRGAVVRGIVWHPGERLGSVSVPGAKRGTVKSAGVVYGGLVVE